MKTLKIIAVAVAMVFAVLGIVYAQSDLGIEEFALRGSKTALFGSTNNAAVNLRWNRESMLGAANPVDTVAKPGIGGSVKAANKLIKYIFNPDELIITSKEKEGDILTLKYAFGLKEITVHATISTSVAYVDDADDPYAEAALATRNQVAEKMNVDIGMVHINRIDPKHHILVYPGPSQTIGLTARVDKYTLTLDYTAWSGWLWPDDPIKIIHETINTIWIGLISFVDNDSGIDYVKAAKLALFELCNSNVDTAETIAWAIENGIVDLKLDLGYAAADAITPVKEGLEQAILVKIDLATGKVEIDKEVVNAVLKTREDAARRLGISMSDTHIDEIYRYVLPYSVYTVQINTPAFHLGLEYRPGDANPMLRYIISVASNQDLLANANRYLSEKFSGESFELTNWKLGLGEYNEVYFTFIDTGTGATVSVGVNGNTGLVREHFMEEKVIELIPLPSQQEPVDRLTLRQDMQTQQTGNIQFVGEMAGRQEESQPLIPKQ